MYGEITLIEPINDEKVEEITVYAEVYSVTQSEYVAAGKQDIKPAYKFEIYQFEYDGQTDIKYNGKRLTVYRTYPKEDGRIELYTEERGGKRWQT